MVVPFVRCNYIRDDGETGTGNTWDTMHNDDIIQKDVSGDIHVLSFFWKFRGIRAGIQVEEGVQICETCTLD